MRLDIYIEPYAVRKQEDNHELEHTIGLNILCRGLREQYSINLTISELKQQIEKNKYGKPYLKEYPNIYFNISHCDGRVAVAFSDSPIGVDIEKIGEFHDNLARKMLSTAEYKFLQRYKQRPKMYREMFFRFWTLKESSLKCLGYGFHIDPQSIAFEMEEDEAEIRVKCRDKSIFVQQQIIDKEYILAIAIRN